MSNTYKRLVLEGIGGPWKMEETEIPKPGVGQILIKMKASSVCNQTDLNTIRGYHPPHDHQILMMVPHNMREYRGASPDTLADVYPARKYPLNPYPTTMGHEGMGEIIAMGPMPEPVQGDNPLGRLMDLNQELKVGDRVAMAGTIGGFGEYVLTVPEECVLIPDCLTDEQASLMEPVMVVSSIIQQCVIQDDEVLILGQGALGLIATQLAKLYGAKRIITTEPIAFKRELSKKFGADEVLDPNEVNIVHAVEELTDGEMMPCIIECAGVPQTIRMIPYLAKLGCRVGQIGACCEPVTVDWSYIHFKGMKITSQIQGNLLGTTINQSGQRAVNLMQRMDLDSLITHHPKFTVEDTEMLFKEIEEKEDVIKAVFTFE